jgi:ATP-dependent protease ClpP protease subunit
MFYLLLFIAVLGLATVLALVIIVAVSATQLRKSTPAQRVMLHKVDVPHTIK